MAEFYRQFPSQGCSSPLPATPPDVDTAMKQWEYNEKLAMFMFQVGSRAQNVSSLQQLGPGSEEFSALLLDLTFQLQCFSMVL